MQVCDTKKKKIALKNDISIINQILVDLTVFSNPIIYCRDFLPGYFSSQVSLANETFRISILFTLDFFQS